jgi:potassium-transporting ATPase KdpC subunit
MSAPRATAPSGESELPAVGPSPPPVHSLRAHLRATGLFLLVTVLVVGFVYPYAVTGIAQVIDPYNANGSILHYANGTAAGSALIAQNTSAPWLFWERPSATDYNMTEGVATDPGPTDPLLGEWLNETIAYMKAYGNFTVNATLPFWLVSPSASSIDPDLTPEAVLVQVPRVAEANNLTIANVTALVNAQITNPPVPDLGVAYVNVLELDLALVAITGR